MASKEYMRQYYLSHKKEFAEKKKRWMKNHPDYYKEHYSKNPDSYKERSKKWRKDNPEKLKILLEKRKPLKREFDREYSRKRRANNPGLKAKEFSDWKKRNPEKYKAHYKLNLAIKKGQITRSPCAVCGECRKYRVHAHHDNYNKPFEVRWLCVVHHKAVHK